MASPTNSQKWRKVEGRGAVAEMVRRFPDLSHACSIQFDSVITMVERRGRGEEKKSNARRGSWLPSAAGFRSPGGRTDRDADLTGRICSPRRRKLKLQRLYSVCCYEFGREFFKGRRLTFERLRGMDAKLVFPAGRGGETEQAVLFLLRR